jgi:FkbH-like protein
MLNFIELIKKTNGDSSNFKELKLAVLGDSATQMFHKAIKAIGYKNELNFKIYEADYNKIDQEIFNPSSELYNFKPDFIIIFYSSQKLMNRFNKNESESKIHFAKTFTENLNKIYDIVTHNLGSKLIVNNFVQIDNRVYGNYSNKIEESFLYQLRKINYELMNLAIENKNLFIYDIDYLSHFNSNKEIFDQKFYINSDLAFSLNFFAEMSKYIMDIILAVEGSIKKCLILDLDNTLWGGVIGDDGLEKIQIGDLGIGKIYTEIQYWAKCLKNRGIILAVCSKNTHEVAIEPFEKHPDMVLKLNDISIFVANWENKADNIRYIQRVLNIGFDSMVFIDDNPAERSIVRENIPQVIVPELPADPADYLSTIRELNLFEVASVSENDKNRTEQYKNEAKRVIFKEQFTDEKYFLKSLKMISKCSALNSFNIPRISQLSQRSNQFNLRTIRYLEEDLNLMKNSNDYYGFSFTLDDKFGSNGIISAIILHKQESSFFIDTWIMSCRVLKREMENLVLNFIVEFASQKGIDMIIGERIPTKKNKLVLNHYRDLGFVENEGKWFLDVDNYEVKKHQINLMS